ncbi:non-ribosomal peptide synthetase [Longispora sp. NPDC051575]|uniref:non-ribosomal peptide synthetase n=1 Tax=Longispora sp. NPDC051575 TaxID=3154943 RepID=UPI003424F365
MRNTLHGLFERHAQAAPDRVAVVAGAEILTYGELNRQANQVARHLREEGVGPETLVGIGVHRSVDMLVGLLAILKAGGAYVPLDPGLPAERLSIMVRDTGAPIIVTEHRVAAGLRQLEVPLLLLDEPGAFERYPTENLPETSSADGLAYVIYTSGSTGRPKGVMVTHAGVVNLVTAQSYVSVGPEDRVAALATLAFDASSFELWAPLLHGATCVVYAFAGDELSVLVDRLRRDSVSVLHLTSPVFRLLEPRHFRALSGVHTILFGGDAVRGDVGTQAANSFHGRLIHLYGPTETTGFATFQEVEATARNATLVPIGRPIRHVHARILRPDGQAVEEGHPGELYIGGRGVARGYLNRPDLTAERFVSDPARGGEARMYRTGDLVKLGEDGAMHFLGRLDRQVKVRGYRIELSEIEEAITRHPTVRDAVVLVREDGTGDKRIDAYLVSSEAEGNIDPEQLVADVRRHLLGVLPRYQHPATLTVISAIPLTDNLKVDESRLPAPTSGRRDTADGGPGGDLENMLTKLWQTTFGLAEVGVDDNFFDLGGDSISAIHFAATAERATGRRVMVGDVLRNPTIRQLHDVVAQAPLVD